MKTSEIFESLMKDIDNKQNFLAEKRNDFCKAHGISPMNVFNIDKMKAVDEYNEVLQAMNAIRIAKNKIKEAASEIDAAFEEYSFEYTK